MNAHIIFVLKLAVSTYTPSPKWEMPFYKMHEPINCDPTSTIHNSLLTNLALTEFLDVSIIIFATDVTTLLGSAYSSRHLFPFYLGFNMFLLLRQASSICHVYRALKFWISIFQVGCMTTLVPTRFHSCWRGVVKLSVLCWWFYHDIACRPIGEIQKHWTKCHIYLVSM